MTLRWRTLLGLVALWAANACGGDSSPTDETPGHIDESSSCGDAVALTSDTNNLGGSFYTGSGTIDGSGDTDFFSFPMDAGEWIQLIARANPTENGLDTEITLFDSDGSTQLAYNDDSVSGGGLDSALPYLPASTGTGCIEIADVQGAAAELDYHLVALPVDFDLYDDFNLDTEPNNSTASAQVGLTFFESGTSRFTMLMGDFDPAGDIDFYQWDVPAGAVTSTVTFPPSFGTDGYGSTTEVGKVEIYESDGSQVYARLDPRTGADGLVVPVSPSTYFVAVHPPESGASGSNPFYVFPLSTTANENEQEADDVANDASTAAEMPSPVSSGSQTSYFVGGTLPSPGDTDWWQVSAEAGDEIALFCASWRVGSGVRDATFSIYDDPGASPLESEQEVEDSDVAWFSDSTVASRPAITATQSGPHYLRVDGTKYDAEVSGAYYICGVHVLA